MVATGGHKLGHKAFKRLSQLRAYCHTTSPSRSRLITIMGLPAFQGIVHLSGSCCSIQSTRGQNLMTVRLHRGDLPDLSRYTSSVASDTAPMGLDPHRDRLCVVQLSNGDGSADVVQIPKDHAEAPNLKTLLGNPNITKIFHFARFDIAALYNAFGVIPQPVYCTKIASRLSRTYTDRHGLKDLVREVLNIDLSKQQQSSDWGLQSLNGVQRAYGSSDVRHLHAF